MADSNFWTSTVRQRASRRGFLRAGALTGAGLAGAALIGCGDEDESPTPAPGTPAPGGTTPPTNGTPAATATPAAGEPRAGGVLHLASQTPPVDNFNIVRNTNEGNYLSTSHIYDTMFTSRVGRERDQSLEAAESVEIVDDVTIVFKLHEGMVFQDKEPVNGRAVLADDIVAFFEYVRDSDTAVDRSFQTTVIDSVEATDDRTVTYHFQRPYAYSFSVGGFAYPLNNAIVPSELLDDLDRNVPVGSGPYQMKDYQFGVQYHYERNPTYRRAPLPYIDEVVRYAINDSSALEAAFRGERITVHYAPQPEIADRLLADLGDQIYAEEFLALGPNQATIGATKEWTKDIRAREAFYRTIDLQQYLDLILDGRGVQNLSMVQAGLTPYLLEDSEAAPYRRHDPEAARQLLDAAGFDFDAEYVLSTAQGGGSGRNEPALQILAEQLRQVGITNTSYDVRLSGEFISIVSNQGLFDFGLWANAPSDVPQRMNRLHHTETRTQHNSTNMLDPEVDALIEASESEVNYEAHVELVKDLQRMLLEKYARTQLVWASYERQLHWNYLHNFEPVSSLVVMPNAEAWLDL